MLPTPAVGNCSPCKRIINRQQRRFAVVVVQQRQLACAIERMRPARQAVSLQVPASWKRLADLHRRWRSGSAMTEDGNAFDSLHTYSARRSPAARMSNFVGCSLVIEYSRHSLCQCYSWLNCVDGSMVLARSSQCQHSLGRLRGETSFHSRFRSAGR